MAVPIISRLKDKVSDHTDRVVILDSPPGTACPVVEVMRGSDFVLLVTEPTPFGLNDLKLAVETVRLIGLPFGVIINRDGVGDNSVETYLHHEKIPILLKIPQSQEIAKLYSDGIPFSKKLPYWPKEFKNIFKKIKSEVVK